jgi:integrase
VTPHTLGRTFGSSLINAGTPLHVVSHRLGHSNTTVTERAYAQLEAQTAAVSVLRSWPSQRALPSDIVAPVTR